MHLLLLLHVPLLQLLSLLLVLLFGLLLPRLIGILLRQSLVLFVLLLLQLLPFLVLLLLELLLLLLVFLIRLRVPCVGRSRALHGWKILGMIDGSGVAAVLGSRLSRPSIRGRVIRSSSLSRWNSFAPSKCPGSGGGREWRLAVTRRRS